MQNFKLIKKKKEIDGMPVNLVHVIPRSFVHKCKAGFDPSYILIRSVFLSKEGVWWGNKNTRK